MRQGATPPLSPQPTERLVKKVLESYTHTHRFRGFLFTYLNFS